MKSDLKSTVFVALNRLSHCHYFDIRVVVGIESFHYLNFVTTYRLNFLTIPYEIPSPSLLVQLL